MRLGGLGRSIIAQMVRLTVRPKVKDDMRMNDGLFLVSGTGEHL